MLHASSAHDRQIVVRASQARAFKARKKTAGLSEKHQLHEALSAYLEREPQRSDRALLNDQEGLQRKIMPVSNELWERLRARKREWGLDLDEQVQIALSLYFGRVEGTSSATMSDEPGVLAVRRGSQNVSGDPLLAAARVVLSNAALAGDEPTVLLSLPSVPCGPWREALSDASPLALPRELAEILGAREGDLLIPTDGQSMVEAGVPDGGRVVMRPLRGRRPELGQIVLCCIEREGGVWESTIKFWFETPRGAPILRDGRSREVPLPGDTVEVHPVAVLVGVMGRATQGTAKGLPSPARRSRRPDEDPLAE